MSNELQLVDDGQNGEALPVAHQNTQIRTTGSTPADLVRFAMESGADLDRLERLMQMQIDWEKREAEKAYHAAVAAFKENAPVIRKNKKASFETRSGGKTAYDFATLGNVVSAIVPELAKHGLSHRWVPDQNGSLIGVTCILTHRQGHSESIRLEAGKDDTGGKNSIQAIGSAKSYLERYTLLAITGLAVDEMDDEGRAAGVSHEDAPEPTRAKPIINAARFAQAIAKVRANEYPAANVRKNFNLTIDQETALADAEAEAKKGPSNAD